jgi:hypothetical protein
MSFFFRHVLKAAPALPRQTSWPSGWVSRAATRLQAQRKDSRPSDKRRFERTQRRQPTAELFERGPCRRGVSGASAVQCASRRIHLHVRVATKADGSEKSHKIRVVSVRHRHDALGTPTVRPTVTDRLTVTGPSASIWTPRCPIDATRRFAPQPQKVRHGIPRRIYAQCSSRNLSYKFMASRASRPESGRPVPNRARRGMNRTSIKL